MLDTAVEGSVDNGYTVYPPQIWIHTDTLVRYISETYILTACTTSTSSFVREQPSLTALPRRPDAAHGTADKLVYCHEAMHVQQRMQDAGWSADVERWESDEDSDGSGDEGGGL